MPSKNPTARSIQATVAVAYSRGKGDTPEIQELRRDLRAIKLEEYVRKIVAEAPPLTPEQAARISALLWGGDR
ncbi:hypothetical protein [Sinomonas sp. G460-2]|uniref:hypothetical protein n=1 Tax=Sinomonas sp. G460-2 TaxID=3393464 RepID=UPI0039F124E0